MFLSTSTQQIFHRQWAIAQDYPIPIWRIMLERSFNFVAGSDTVVITDAALFLAIGDRLLAGDYDYNIIAVNSGSVIIDSIPLTSATRKGYALRSVTIDGVNFPRVHQVSNTEKGLLEQPVDKIFHKVFKVIFPIDSKPEHEYLLDNSIRYALELAYGDLEVFSVESPVSDTVNPELAHVIYLAN